MFEFTAIFKIYGLFSNGRSLREPLLYQTP